MKEKQNETKQEWKQNRSGSITTFQKNISICWAERKKRHFPLCNWAHFFSSDETEKKQKIASLSCDFPVGMIYICLLGVFDDDLWEYTFTVKRHGQHTTNPGETKRKTNGRAKKNQHSDEREHFSSADGSRLSDRIHSQIIPHSAANIIQFKVVGCWTRWFSGWMNGSFIRLCHAQTTYTISLSMLRAMIYPNVTRNRIRPKSIVSSLTCTYTRNEQMPEISASDGQQCFILLLLFLIHCYTNTHSGQFSAPRKLLVYMLQLQDSQECFGFVHGVLCACVV